MDLDFSDADIERYSRHILLAEVGGVGQASCAAARVLVVGAGGLGSPLILYLAAAGIGTIGIVDGDMVDLSNLQRQIAHTTRGSAGQGGLGGGGGAGAQSRRGWRSEERLTPATRWSWSRGYDIVCDGTDNFATRFLVADACVLARRTLVSAAVLRFEGQLSTFKPHAGAGCPCYRCLYPEPPPDGLVPTCSEAGVLGAVTGVMGTLQATEVLKEMLGIGEGMAGRLLVWDALAARFRTIRLNPTRRAPPAGRRRRCAICRAHVAAPAPACAV